MPPRVHARELWRIGEEHLQQAQDDATLLAIRDQERAGIDVITDGEIRRESYSNWFATALEGMDVDTPGVAYDRTGRENPVPRVVGPVGRPHPVEVRDLEFLRANTDRRVKITLPGPFTMSQQAQNDYYPNQRSLALDLARAVAEEIRDLFAAGADVVQIDEPYLQARPEAATEYALEAIDLALADASGETALHTCFGYGYVVRDKPSGYAFVAELDGCRADEISVETAQPRLDLTFLEQLTTKRIALGVLDLATETVETPHAIAARAREALEHVDAARLVLAPDCGMKYLSREAAFAKLEALAAGARLASGAPV